jgi:hypothetical protein
MSTSREERPLSLIDSVVHGRLAICGVPALNLRVEAWQSVQFGAARESRPSVPRVNSLRRVGRAVSNEDGEFTMRFESPTKPDDASDFSSLVRIDVFSGAIKLWSSGYRDVRPVVEFDRELAPGCEPRTKMILVINDFGVLVPDAQVFVNGRLEGSTDATGQLFLPVSTGDTLVARKLVHQNSTPRDDHDVDSTSNWNYRVYITSLSVNHDANGDNLELRPNVVGPDPVQILRVRRQNTLIGLNLVMSIEWDASNTDHPGGQGPPGGEFDQYRDRHTDMSELLYNATDGQFLIEHLKIGDDGRYWEHADRRVYANLNQKDMANTGTFFESSGVIKTNPNSGAHEAGNFLHEFGHYGFSLGDERDPPCTAASTGTDEPFGDGAEKKSCFMNSARRKDRQKLCSGHPANPHVPQDGRQKDECWSVVSGLFGSWLWWRLQTPDSRGAIPGLLPDSGLPLLGTTDPPNGQRPLSFIPVADWKVKLRTTSVSHANPCPGLIARILRFGQPFVGARVHLRTHYGRRLYQGATKDGQSLAWNVTTGPGELLIRGAHVDDEIEVRDASGWVIFGRQKITSCTSPLVINADSWTIDWPDGPFLSTRSAWPGEWSTVDTPDGGLQLSIRPDALTEPDVVEVEELPERVNLGANARIVSGPYHITLVSGADVSASLLFRVLPSDVPDLAAVRVVRLGADGSVDEIPHKVHDDLGHVAADVDRLGRFALICL